MIKPAKTQLKAAKKAFEKKRPKGPIEYTCLAKCNIGDNVNFFGVVLDASYPHKSYKSGKFICSLKVADHSCATAPDGVVAATSVVFFATSLEDLPICQRIGEVIRIHRAQVGTFNGNK